MKLIPEIVKNFLKKKICQVCKKVSSFKNKFCRNCHSNRLRLRRVLKAKK